VRRNGPIADATANRIASRPALNQLVVRAGLSLAWERAWPALAGLLACLCVFLAVSWLGLWLPLPGPWRIAGVALFGLAGLVSLLPLRHVVRLSRAEALARIDRDSGLPHRPASALADALVNPSGDAATEALWTLHQARLRDVADHLSIAPPSPGLARRDPFALRAAALLACVAAAFVAGPERGPRLAAAFDWRHAAAAQAGFRFDAWIDPPLYTGRPPILLNPKTAADGKTPRRVEAPAGSTVIVRSSADQFVVTTKGGLNPVAKAAGAERESEQRFTLTGDAEVGLARAGVPIATFNILAIPDRPPTIVLSEKPSSNLHGSLTLAYKIDDDYGVARAEANFARPEPQGRSLVEPPKIVLSLPAAPGGIGEAQTISDLSEHPWAGSRVTVTLSARDEGGNVGTSEPTEMRLPQRPFNNPLAKALVEQRRNLVLDPDEPKKVAKALSALLIAPDRFGLSGSVYLGLSVTLQALDAAKTDDALREVAALLWEIALRIEDGDASSAERELRNAENQLREALQHGASEEEIKRLTDQLQAALDRYLSELADQMAREDNANPQASPPDRRANRTITQRDLKSMLDQLQEMAKSGSLADAQRMLDQLQSILENLRSAKRGRMDPAEREMNQALDELDTMTRDEQQLRDDTFRQNQQQRQGQAKKRRQQSGQKGQSGKPNQQGEDQSAEDEDTNAPPQGSDRLRQRQQDLRQRLDDLKRRMKQLGMSPEKGLDDAEEAMNEAEGALAENGEGEGKAVDAEGRAIEGLRRGTQGLADQLQQQGEAMGQGDPNGSQGSNQQSARGRGYRDDPLGRRSEPNGNGVNGQQNDGREAAASPAQRARKVLEELRRRLGERERPREELDYLERLIRRD
jgi:uncharacterized protein (TIGR02302 family)